MASAGNRRAVPGRSSSVHAGARRRAPSSVRAASVPSTTTRRGVARSISRYRKGRQMASSAGVGGRFPGGRQGIRGASNSRARSRAMLASMRSSVLPSAPANGRPARSSSAAGGSPISSSPAAGSPVGSTAWVAVSRRAQPSKSAIAAYSASSVAAAVAAAAARSAAEPRDANGVGAAGAASLPAATGGAASLPAATGVAGRPAGTLPRVGRSRSTGVSSSASSAPNSI